MYLVNSCMHLIMQVANMIGYAVGETVEYTNTVTEDEEREEESGGAVVQRQQSSHLSCYEVVTAWVHPRYGNPVHVCISLPHSLPLIVIEG